MVETFMMGRPTGKVPLFILKKEDAYINFLRRIYFGKGGPLPEYFVALRTYPIPGGRCYILLEKYIVTVAPWPRLVTDE